MANKWQITIDVDEAEKILLCKALDFTAHEKPARNAELYNLEAKIELAWIEREVEMIPPPSEWSKHFAHAVSKVLDYRGD